MIMIHESCRHTADDDSNQKIKHHFSYADYHSQVMPFQHPTHIMVQAPWRNKNFKHTARVRNGLPDFETVMSET